MELSVNIQSSTYQLNSFLAYNMALNECLNNLPNSVLYELLRNFYVNLSFNISKYYVCITGIKKNIYYDIYHIDSLSYLNHLIQLRLELIDLILLSNYCADIFISTSQDNYQLIILISASDNVSCDLQTMIKQIAKNTQVFFNKYIFKHETAYHTTTSISKICSGIESIKAGYDEARYLNDLSFFHMNSTIHNNEWLMNTQQYHDALIHKRCRSVLQAIDDHSDTALKLLDTLYNTHLRNDLDFDLVEEINAILIRALSLRINVYESNIIINKDDFKINNHITINSLYANFAYIISQLLKSMKPQIKHSLHTLQAIYFIKGTYDRDISLLDIADYVGIDSNYLSNHFKSVTGCNISNYIVDYRLKQANLLITNTNLTIASIAKRVGYKDVKYFSKMYKQTYLVNPSDHRTNK